MNILVNFVKIYQETNLKKKKKTENGICYLPSVKTT